MGVKDLWAVLDPASEPCGLAHWGGKVHLNWLYAVLGRMGVKDLWAVLDPASEPCGLADLRGKRLAVDVSGWVHQARDTKAVAGKDELQAHLSLRSARLARSLCRFGCVC